VRLRSAAQNETRGATQSFADFTDYFHISLKSEPKFYRFHQLLSYIFKSRAAASPSFNGASDFTDYCHISLKAAYIVAVFAKVAVFHQFFSYIFETRAKILQISPIIFIYL
jgi:hypothetical protein